MGHCIVEAEQFSVSTVATRGHGAYDNYMSEFGVWLFYSRVIL